MWLRMYVCVYMGLFLYLNLKCSVWIDEFVYSLSKEVNLYLKNNEV